MALRLSLTLCIHIFTSLTLSISREQPSTFTETLKNFFTKNKRLQSYGGMIKYYMVMYINIKNVLECN